MTRRQLQFAIGLTALGVYLVMEWWNGMATN
jgi:hypothetical protein